MIKIFKFLIIISFGYFQFIDFSAYAQEKIKVGLLVQLQVMTKSLVNKLSNQQELLLKILILTN